METRPEYETRWRIAYKRIVFQPAMTYESIVFWSTFSSHVSVCMDLFLSRDPLNTFMI